MKKKNTFKKLVIDSRGRLVDSAKRDPIPEFSLRLLLFSYFISLSILILFFTFAYLILKTL